VQCPLKYDEEKRYLLCALIEHIHFCVNEKRRLEFDKVIIPRNNTLIIMRLFEGTKLIFHVCTRFEHHPNAVVILLAYFHPSHRKKLLNYFNSMTRKELDRRNSVDRPKDALEDIADRFNTKTWIPQSTIFSDLHPTLFTKVIDLPLPDNFEPWDYDKVKNAIKEYLSRLKKAIEKWKQSGNGKGNRRGEGGEIKIRFKDTRYIIPQDEDDTEKTDDKVEIRYEYVDDDRIDFCNQDNAVLYVWGLADKYGFADFCVQNISVIATKDGMAVSAREGGGRGANNNRKNRLTEAISKLPEAVAQVFEDARVHDEMFNLQSLLVQHKNLLRQAKTKKEEW
jgi:hypothetical protein